MPGQQVAPVKAIGILATAFLASLSASSFFFIQPGSGANADSVSCSTQGTVRDTIQQDIVSLTVEISKGCPESNGILYGVDSNGIAYKIEEVAQITNESNELGRTVYLEVSLISDYSYYTFEIEKAFSAKITSK